MAVNGDTRFDTAGIRWVKLQAGTRRSHERRVLGGAHVALCHEWTMQMAGSEKVASAIADLVRPDAVFTLAARPEVVARLFPGYEVWVPKLGLNRSVQRRWNELLPFFHAAWATLSLERFDVVITSSHSCVNAVRAAGRPHVVCYCHTPMRYAWAWKEERSRVPPPLRPVWPAAAAALRFVDRHVAKKVDTFVANSGFVADRIERAYGAPSDVVNPPVNTTFYTPGPPTSKGYFLFAGRLVGYKRPDIAVEASRRAGVNLVVAGSGAMLNDLRRHASAQTRFVENPTNEDLRGLYRGARALISPGVEDFGITNVEAMACGTPVIAYDRGGARDSVIAGRSGIMVDEQLPESFARVMADLPTLWDRTACREVAEGFSLACFRERMSCVLAATSR